VLEELHIRDVGVIDDVTVQFGPGLTVVTGETGAGKTMVVQSLRLLMGARADSDQVRRGARAALVEGRIAPPPPGSADWVDDGEDELVVAREVAASGRGRARIGGRMAPASALEALVGGVVELHGQSDSARLAEPALQRELLDRSGGPRLTAALASYREAYQEWRAAEAELAALQGSERDRAREVDRLQFELGEIDEVTPVAGEEETLDADLARLEHAEALIEAARTAAAAVTEDGGARDGLGIAVAGLRQVAGTDPQLDALHDRAEGLAAEVQDLALELSGYAGDLELDPERLDQLRDRRMALSRLTRKYGIDAAAVAAYAEEARARLIALQSGDERREALAARVGDLAARVGERAAVLRRERTAAGRRLAKAVDGHLGELAMTAARMTVAVEAADPGPTGADKVTFLLAANLGEPALPLGKAASGGERSRVALAVRLALADADDTSVLVFDEVDAGIGGATALAVGRKLARLARGRQVLCVTHLAQLAAFADAHVVVTKSTANGRTRADVVALGEDERVAELSRMLSGAADSEAAARHAAELRASALASVGATPPPGGPADGDRVGVVER